MKKALGSWSGMRKYLEQDMLADCLKGRIRYNCTAYDGMDGSRIFEIFADGKAAKHFCLETVNTYFIKQGLKENNRPVGTAEYWEGFQALADTIPLQSRSEYTDDEFCNALERYRNQLVSDSLNSANPLERMFALLDRRVGKRTLAAFGKTLDEQPSWLADFYRLRADAEWEKCICRSATKPL